MAIDLTPSDVPCGSCVACCKGDIRLLDGDDAGSYLTVRMEDGTKKLAQTQSGWCVYSRPTGCAIYETRPIICKAFDCRRLVRSIDRLPEAERAAIIAANLIGSDVLDAGRARA